MRLTLAICTIIIVLCGCSGASDDIIDNNGKAPTEDNNGSKPGEPAKETPVICIAPTVNGEVMTKENGFAAGDMIGLFIYYHNNNGTAERIANIPFTYDGEWKTTRETLWKDSNDSADFYAYYPYSPSVTDEKSLLFTVETEQNCKEDLEKSDLLAGGRTGVTSADKAVDIQMKHLMSQIQVTLAAGNGMSEEKLKGLDITVRVDNVRCSANIDMEKAAVTATGDTRSVTTWNDNGTYKAMIVPQTVEEEGAVTICINGKEQHLNKAITFEPGKIYKLTTTLEEVNSSFNIGITGWETDDIDHGGTAE